MVAQGVGGVVTDTDPTQEDPPNYPPHSLHSWCWLLLPLRKQTLSQ